MAEETKKPDVAPIDYAALLRSVRDSESLKLEIHQLQNQLKTSSSKIMMLEQQVASMTQGITERDEKIEELQGQVGDKSKGLVSKLKQKDETIQRLQAALQGKHREIEELKARGGIFGKK